jgi:hypothetical protein
MTVFKTDDIIPSPPRTGGSILNLVSAIFPVSGHLTLVLPGTDSVRIVPPKGKK